MAVCRVIPDSKKGYLELFRDLTSELQTIRCEAGATTQKVADREPRLGKLEFKMHLLVDEALQAGDLQNILDGKVRKCESVKKSLGSKSDF